MEATNTCGEHFPIEYCVQTGTSDVKKSCEICRQYDHDSRFLTDLHNNYNATWWQSETMLEGVQFPSQVNLTLHLGKSQFLYHRSVCHPKSNIIISVILKIVSIRCN